MVVALTLLTSSQGILIVWSKRNGKYEYSVTTSNFMVSIIIILPHFVCNFQFGRSF